MSKCYADCIFNVTNNSTQTIIFEGGFFNGNKVSLSVAPATSSYQILKSDRSCMAVSASGLGISYVSLIGGKSSGGWVYDPSNQMIRAMGKHIISADGRIGTSPNGLEVLLTNNTKPKKDVFEVTIINIKRNVSRQLGSSN